MIEPSSQPEPAGDAVPSQDSRTRWLERILIVLRWTVVLSVVVGAIIVIVQLAMGEDLSDEGLEAFVAGFGPMAPLVFLVVFALIGSLIIPTTVLTIVGATLFGPLLGFVYSQLGAFIAAMLGFAAARTVARKRVTDWLERRGGRVAALERRLERHGFTTAFFMRLLYLPNGLINVCCGVSNMRSPVYAAATFLGLFPLVFAIAFITGGAKDALLSGDLDALRQPEVLFSIALFLVCIAIPIISGVVRKKLSAGRFAHEPLVEISGMFDSIEAPPASTLADDEPS